MKIKFQLHEESYTFAFMIRAVSIEDFYSDPDGIPVVDVRSPGEFDKGHIPGAVNISLFSDRERADVGTAYVQNSREEAVKLGYEYVTPKMDWFIAESRKIAAQSVLAVHCWRGGMRSKAFAEHLQKNGFQDILIIEGGYKAFRRHVLDFFKADFQLRVLGGFTGSGKTHILKILKEQGEQVIDLEALAHHKGSVFGGLGEEVQPRTQQFENRLFTELRKLDRAKPVWVEDESQMIGSVCIPGSFFRQIREQTTYFIEIPREQRAQHLVREYAIHGNELLGDAIDNIYKRLGGQNVKLAHQYLEQNKHLEVALLVLQFYDKAYRNGVRKRNRQKVFSIPLPGLDHVANARAILKFVTQHERN